MLDGRYRIVRPLGEGGMGVVYEAEHLLLRRRVAVKLLHPRYASVPEAVRRFVREARAVAAVGHQGIVDVLDFGSVDGRAYLVMELLAGETLADRLDREGTLSIERACHITAQALSAISAAHAAGVVHRDLKPENIFLVRPESGRDQVKLLDFGISKVQSLEGDDCRTTGNGNPLGTPGYMAPEQWMCAPDVDHRADLYSLGVMLYEMLTAELPFDAEVRGEQFIKVVVSQELPRPVAELRSDATEELDRVLLRALARKKTERFQRAGEFYAALGPFGVGDVLCEDLEPGSKIAVQSRDSVGPSLLGVERLDAAELVTEPPELVARVPSIEKPVVQGSKGSDESVKSTVAGVQTGRLSDHAVSDPGPAGVVLSSRDSSVHSPVSRRRWVALTMALLAAVVTAAWRFNRGVSAPTRGGRQTVKIELRGLGPDATVKVDGRAVQGARVTLARDNARHSLEISRAGDSRTVNVVADRDQLVLVDWATAEGATVSPRETEGVAAVPETVAAPREREGRRSRHGRHRAPDIFREF